MGGRWQQEQERAERRRSRKGWLPQKDGWTLRAHARESRQGGMIG